MKIESKRFKSLNILRIERDSIVIKGPKGEVCLNVNCSMLQWDNVIVAVKNNDYDMFCKNINLNWAMMSQMEELNNDPLQRNIVANVIDSKEWDKMLLDRVGVGSKKVLQFAKRQLFNNLKS